MNNEASLFYNSLPLMLRGALATINIAVVALIIGLCCGIVLGILNSKKFQRPWSERLINAFVNIIRGTPLFVQVLIAYYALPEILGITLSPFNAGVIALGVNSTAYISEIVRGGIDAIPQGQWEAAYVLGLKPRGILQTVILPQMFHITMPSLINEMTSLIKETSILMVIGVAELTKVSKDIVARELDPTTIYLAAAGIYLLMTSGISYLAKWLHRRKQT